MAYFIFGAAPNSTFLSKNSFKNKKAVFFFAYNSLFTDAASKKWNMKKIIKNGDKYDYRYLQ
ncbi:MAG: hypothetical protein J6A07_08060, partial [Firmicutes bacterium]|nr:hypothetical protein [Bacillota bacterium]